MSMDRCNSCGCIVDTDDDVGAYIQQWPDGKETELNSCRCEWCRDEVYEQEENNATKSLTNEE